MERNLITQLYVNERDAAKLLGMSVHWFRADRLGKRLVPFTRIGKSVRYAVADLKAYAESNKVGGAR